MSALRTDPFAGAILQVGVLAALAGTVGLSAYGWLAGLLFGVVTVAALGYGLRRSGADRLGPADWVTLTRATLAGGVAALTVDSFREPIVVPVLVVLSAVALSLDWVDGQVARRTGTVSALGARFDMEVDSFLVLVLCGYVADQVGAWVLVIGAMRYVFVAAGWVLPWMRGSLPPRYWRKVVAATQGIALAVVAAGVLPRLLAVAVLLGALAMLVESFGRDVAWLWRHRVPSRRRPVALPAAPVSPAPAGHRSEWAPGARIAREPAEVGGRRP
ncbi:CDP-alcohol phosphatidyltransferase [Micromonospora sp. L5]|uniref:CDP-alcohol phosphatidyltransferase family protein n=1 Tax=Micromonospora aurantiaca (nom. illeg.) TaxID=47850 RepID=A0ABQ6UGU8_9ACTN|nr:CDP-alcohol phosphatidyltransferase [Micromonospora sp. L5]KAB1113910.1 CDP-alcohol phosphatidyltransferase family protein [Micromonospora aurantiaca]RNI00325.1 CDP-alcohol phosphatidyltransferase family protein [Micromonospora aurantiaca]